MNIAAADPGRSHVDQAFVGGWGWGGDLAEVEGVGWGGGYGEVLLLEVVGYGGGGGGCHFFRRCLDVGSKKYGICLDLEFFFLVSGGGVSLG